MAIGGYYVNDFNKFGRVWQVQVQGEERDRESFEDVYRIHVRNAQGEMAECVNENETPGCRN